MADSKVSALTEMTGADVDIAADYINIVDTSTTTSKKILPSNLLGAAFTTAGDILQASGDGVAARLGIGTKRQVPMVNAGATALAYANPITLVAEQATTSGTSITFSSIPAGVRRITIMFVGVSTNGTSIPLIQIGDSGGVETTGYLAAALGHAGAAVGGANHTAGFGVRHNWSDSYVAHGKVVLDLQNASTFLWVCDGHLYQSESSTTEHFGGSKALSAELDRVVITTTNGTDAFDAGAISISYE